MVKYTVSVSNLFLFSSFSLVFAHPAYDVGKPLFLTPYIEKGDLFLARNLSSVQAYYNTNLQSHSGFFTVNKECNSNMFFWYIKAQNKDPKGPIVVWLQGGPGQSSLRGLFSEVGPYRISVENNFELNQHTWTREVSMIFFDSPIGSGYSFSGKGCYPKDMSQIARELLIALKQFQQLFPYEAYNPVYIAGEGFGGQFATIFAQIIHRDKAFGGTINLQGLALGNPVIEPEIQFKHSDFLYNISLIDSKGRLELKMEEDRCQSLIQQQNRGAAFACYDKAILGLFTPTTTFNRLTGFRSYGHYYFSNPQPEGNWLALVTSDELRKVLHVGRLGFNDGKGHLKDLKRDLMKTVKPMLEELLRYYPVLIYNGQHDILVPYPVTQKYLLTLNWPGAEDFKNAQRRPWRVGKYIAGYVKGANNLYEVLIRNAGVMAPRDQAQCTLDLILKFFHNVYTF